MKNELLVGILLFSLATLGSPKITLNLSDPTTGSTTHARQATVYVSIVNDSNAQMWCISEVQKYPPGSDQHSICHGGLGPNNGWFSVEPTTFTLSYGEGLKTVYVWTRDDQGTINHYPIQDKIISDYTKPGHPLVALSDPVTGNPNVSESQMINLTLTHGRDAVSWCTISQELFAPLPQTPLFDDRCWQAGPPTSVTLERGYQRVFVFTKDIAENVSLFGGSALIEIK